MGGVFAPCGNPKPSKRPARAFEALEVFCFSHFCSVLPKRQGWSKREKVTDEWVTTWFGAGASTPPLGMSADNFGLLGDLISNPSPLQHSFQPWHCSTTGRIQTSSRNVGALRRSEIWSRAARPMLEAESGAFT